jgi:hypothetical protein
MTITDNVSTKVMLVAPIGNNEQDSQAYRLRKCFAAVQFDAEAKGRIVFLPEGAEVSVVGSSRVSGCLDVLCGRQRYSMFKVDLWGPWSAPVQSKSAKPHRIDSGRATVAVGACA